MALASGGWQPSAAPPPRHGHAPFVRRQARHGRVHDDCCIFVDGEPYSWRDGQAFVFDETYVHRFQNLTEQPRIIFFADVERPLRNLVVRAINRWVIRHVVGITASRNLESERLGFANRAYRRVYALRMPLKRLKQTNRSVYYAFRWGAILVALYLVLFAGSGLLR